MEELQLALTPARIDQKNFGQWLKSWQTGQVLQALVVGKSPSGKLVLSIDGHQLISSNDIPVQPGTHIKLEVTNIAPRPELKLLTQPPPAETASSPNPVTELLKQVTARQQDTQSSAKALLQGLTNTEGTLPSQQAVLISQLISKLSLSFTSLTRPGLLQSIVDLSGLFYEINTLNKRPPLRAGQWDLKALLFKLLQLADHNPPDNPRGGDTLGQGRELWSKITSNAQDLLTNITYNQLSSTLAENTAKPQFRVEIPFQYAESFSVLTLTIRKRESSSKQSTPSADEAWEVIVAFDLEQIGHIDAEIRYSENKVSTLIYAEQNATFEKIEQQLEKLAHNLHARGLESGATLVRHGRKPPDNPPHFPTIGLQEKA